MDDIEDAERAIIFLSGGFLSNEHAVEQLAELDSELSAKHLIFIYSSELGWKFNYGPPEEGMSNEALRASSSIQL